MRTINLYTIAVFLTLHHTGVNHDVALIIDNSIEFLGRYSQKISNLVGQRTEIPDMCYGYYKANVTCTLATYLLLGNLDTATIADIAFVANALVLTAGTLVVLGRTEDALAEQTVALRLISTIVDGLWFGNLAATLRKNCIGRCQTNGNLGEVTLYLCFFLESHISNLQFSIINFQFY